MAKPLASSPFLVDLTISVWAGRKQDKGVADEIDTAKHTKTKAGMYYKKLLADCVELGAVEKYASEVRAWHYSMTLPWADSGTRLLPSTLWLEYVDGMKAHGAAFERKVEDFLLAYDNQISVAAFKLGTLFNRSEYPTKDQLAAKFKMKYVLSPLPASGDFRVDVGAEALQQLSSEYDKAMEDRLTAATESMYNRLFETLVRTVERLGEGPDGKLNIFRDSLVENINTLVADLRRLNVMNDEKLELMREELARISTGLTADDLRKNKDVRQEVRTSLESMLSKFSM